MLISDKRTATVRVKYSYNYGREMWIFETKKTIGYCATVYAERP
jgi:hypothetical protein